MNENQRGKFISIHGIDGTGKTTTTTTTTNEVVEKLLDVGVSVINHDTHKEKTNNPHESRKKKLINSYLKVFNIINYEGNRTKIFY